MEKEPSFSRIKIDESLRDSIGNAFIDQNNIVKDSSLTPRLLYNNPSKKRKVIDTLKSALLNCDEFFMSVAFITDSGLIFLKEALAELKNRINKNDNLKKSFKGRILTTDYLSFTEPKALKWIRDNTDIETRIYVTHGKENEGGFHTKGYFFRQNDNTVEMIIGSSNLTDSALTKNQEWNSLLISKENGSFFKEAKSEFERLWDCASPFDDYIDTYEKIYESNKAIKEASKNDSKVIEETIEPNTMQCQFVDNLKSSIAKGDKRGLLISATGTGKTYASAFGFRELANDKSKILFLAHSTQILLQSALAYRRIFPNNYKIAILTSEKLKELNGVDQIAFEDSKIRDYNILFAMRQMTADRLDLFDKNSFDYIVIDEAHKSASPTYQRIINHFSPKFLLGMTATPERTEDPEKVFSLFSNNILLEIRLKDALEYNYLCPFHYYGIHDLKGIDDTTYEERDFNKLFSGDRVNYILEKSKYYGYSGKRLHGLIFVSMKEDGKELERVLNSRGYKTKFLSGEDSPNIRNEAIKALSKEEKEGDYLDFIITIDIFNEGIDIPNINQVILLRPTISSIIFIQQLGRGLRLYTGKDYVVILDFIGNYNQNYLIAQALTGEFKGYPDQNTAKMMVASGYIPGISTIEFDEISRQRIFDSISRTNFNTVNSLKRIYENLREKLNRIPTYEDYIKYGDAGFEPVSFFDLSTISYFAFLQKYEIEDLGKYKGDKYRIDSIGLDFLATISLRIGYGKRKQEIEFLLKRVEENKLVEHSLREIKEKYYKTNPNKFDDFKKTLLNVLNRKSQGKAKHTSILNQNDYSFTKEFDSELKKEPFKEELLSLLHYSLNRNERIYQPTEETNINDKTFNTGFKLFEQYTRDDVANILDYGALVGSTMYGYPRSLYNQPFLPVFVNFKKDLPEDASTNYSEGFIDKRTFRWSSRSNENKNSTPLKALANGAKVLLFMRKKAKESYHFFLGIAIAENEDKTQVKGTFHYLLHLEKEINDDIFTLLETNSKELNGGKDS